MSQQYKILKSKPTEDLLYVMDIKEGRDYIIEENESYTAYVFGSDATPNASESVEVMHKCISDLDIYITKLNLYLSDYMLLKKIPNDKLLRLIDRFSVDDLFSHAVSRPRLYQAKVDVIKSHKEKLQQCKKKK